MNDSAKFQKMAEEIKQAVLELADPDDAAAINFGYDDLLMEIGIIDSPGIVDLICWYEENFGIELTDDEMTMDNLGTINLMVAFALTKMEASA